MQEVENAGRLSEIADQVRDGWIRCRGPLTGIKALVAARNEAEVLGASETYLQLLDEIVVAAKALSGGQSTGAFKDAPQVLDRAVPRLREEAAAA
jgi:hypothetical protein